MIEVTVKSSGERADSLLAKETGLSRSAIARLILQGNISLDGKPIKKNHRVTEGESLKVTLPTVRVTEVEAENIPLDIVFEDDDLIVVNKPRGMVVHPAPGHPSGTLVNALLCHCHGSLSGIGGEKRPGIVHRLDKDTSGLIIAAKNDNSHQALSAQLADRSLSREYEAIAHGRFKDAAGSVDAPIGRDYRNRKRMAVCGSGARPAVTHYQVLETLRGYSHIRCRLETGRTHQIRVHMNHIGHPLLGDLLYGRRKPEAGLSGQCLHAAFLKFVHPGTGQYVELRAELPAYFVDIIRRVSSDTSKR